MSNIPLANQLRYNIMIIKKDTEKKLFLLHWRKISVFNNFKIIQNIEFKTQNQVLTLKILMKFGNKMLKPVIRKYTRIANLNENLEFDQFLWAKTGCNQERMLINYGKLIPGESQQCHD